MTLVAAVLLAGLSASIATGEEPTPNRYRITTGTDPRLAHVTATVVARGGHLRMTPWGYPDELPRGWATFVENLTVRHRARTIAAVPDSGPSWTVAVPDGTPLELSYTVRLTHDDHPWESAGGIDARPAVIPGATIWITKALFLVADDSATAEVTFDVPAGTVVSTPWAPVPGAARRWRTTGVEELYDNTVVVGRHLHRELASGDMQVVLAIDPAMAGDAPMITDALVRQMAEYARVLGGTGRARYLVALRRDAVDDGESFSSSFVQMFRHADLASRRIIWESTLAHELFHVSTEHIRPLEQRPVEWFVEGFTEYMASRTLARVGAIDQSLWRRKLGFYFSRYWSSRFMSQDRPSLSAAGANKGRNWRLIYGGGATTALLLDIELRAESDGRVSLDDVFRSLHLRFGVTGRPYTQADLLAAVNEVSSRDWTEFFQCYIDGNGPLPPIDDTLAKAGLRVNGFADEYYVDPVEAPTPAQAAVLAGLSGGAVASAR